MVAADLRRWGCWVALASIAWAGEIPVGLAPRSAGGQPGMEGVVHAFFDDTTGARQGRLRIDRVAVESRREGFLRVAWKPQLVFDGVTLEISPAASWPAAGRQIREALGGGTRAGALLRDVHLHFTGQPARTVNAATGRLRPDGALELQLALASTNARAPTGYSTLLFWLAGPQAGQLLPAPSRSGAAPASKPPLPSRLAAPIP